MRKFAYGLLFLLALLFSLYLTFPFERFTESFLCNKGVTFEKVEFERFPPALKLKSALYKGLKFEEVILYPEVSSLFSQEKNFHLEAKLCGGTLKADFNYPLEKLFFILKNLKLSCLLQKDFKGIDGNLLGSGSFEFDSKGFFLKGGRGTLYLNNLSLKEFKFGLFSLPKVKLGKLKILYRVKGKNYVNLELENKGLVKVSGNGYLKVNLKNLENSYLNLKLRISMAGKPFSFRIAGYLSNLRLR